MKILKRPYCWIKGHAPQKGTMHALMLDWSSKWFNWTYCSRCNKILKPMKEVTSFFDFGNHE